MPKRVTTEPSGFHPRIAHRRTSPHIAAHRRTVSRRLPGYQPVVKQRVTTGYGVGQLVSPGWGARTPHGSDRGKCRWEMRRFRRPFRALSLLCFKSGGFAPLHYRLISQRASSSKRLVSRHLRDTLPLSPRTRAFSRSPFRSAPAIAPLRSRYSLVAFCLSARSTMQRGQGPTKPPNQTRGRLERD